MPGAVQPDEQLEWERRAGRPAGIAAIVGAVLLIGGGILNSRVTETREFARYLRLHDDPSLVIVPNVVQALGYVAIAVALLYLARATAARRSEMASPMKIMAVLGPLANGVAALLLIFAVLKVASDVADLRVPHGVSDPAGGAANLLGNEAAGEKAVQDLQTGSAFYTAVAYLTLASNLALGFALVLVSLNGMRAGLLSRFLGILGIIAGVLTVLFRGAGIIEAFWLGALGAIFLARWPGGRGPAWETVEAIPWPTAMDRQRAAMEEQGELLEPDEEPEVEEPVDEEPVDEQPADGEPVADRPAAQPHPVSKKRKRKRR